MASESAAFSRRMPWAAAAEADWDALFREHFPRVYNYFRYRLGDGPDAEDLASETFERAWRARHRYRRDLGAFSTWLYAIARNMAVDHYRRRRPMAPLEAAMDVAGGQTPEEIAIGRSDHARLERLLAGLADRERELVALKYGAGFTNRAIAKMTGLTETNVGTVLHRTVQTLRASWTEGGET